MRTTHLATTEDLKFYETFITQFDSLEIAFRNAASQGRLDIIRVLASLVNINSKGEKSGDTALHAACNSNQVLAIKLLLELGVSTTKPNIIGEFPNVAKKLGYHSSANHTYKNKSVIINALGLNGIGDFVYAIRAHQACKRRLPANVAVKTILTFSLDGDSSPALLKATKGDVAIDDVYIYDLSSKKPFDEQKAIKKPFIFFVGTKLVTGAYVLPQARTYKFIADKAPQLNHLIKNCSIFLNFGTSLSECPSFDPRQPEKCFSFTEIGNPPSNLLLQLNGSSHLPAHAIEVEMNLFSGDAGLMLDESLLDLMECVKPEELKAHDFNNEGLFKNIMNTKGHFAVGYVQHFYSLAAMLATYRKKFNELKVLTNTNLLQTHNMHQYPFNQFAVVNIFDAKGAKTEYKHKAGQGELNLFPFNGLSCQDKRRYLLLADSTLGSGDNSYIESISVGKPFHWDIPIYKVPAVSGLAAWCSKNQLLHLAKLFYLNCLLAQSKYSGVISKEHLSGYAEFLDTNWHIIVSEVSIFKKIIMKSANFNNYLETILSYNSCNPSEFQPTNTPKPPFIKSDLPSILAASTLPANSTEVIMQLQSMSQLDQQLQLEAVLVKKERLQDVLNSFDPRILFLHAVRMPNKKPAMFGFYFERIQEAVAEDDRNKLERIIDQSPLIDLLQEIPEEIFDDLRYANLLDYAKRNRAPNCFEFLSEQAIRRGGNSDAVRNVFIDYVKHHELKTKGNYKFLIDALGKEEYAKALCVICKSKVPMKLMFAELLCASKDSILKFDINEAFGTKGYTALHQAALQGDLDTYQLLVTHNANPMLKDNDGNTTEKLLAESAKEKLALNR